MVSQRFGPGDLQWLVQAVPMTALVCAATIALLLLLVRIIAQSLGSQRRRTRETPPTSLLVNPTPFLTRDYHYPHLTPAQLHTPGPARALDLIGCSPTGYNEELPHHNMFTSFKSSPIGRHMESLTETLSLEVASKAEHCGEDPQLVQLCVNLIHHYNLDVDQRLPPNGLSIFHQVSLNSQRWPFEILMTRLAVPAVLIL